MNPKPEDNDDDTDDTPLAPTQPDAPEPPVPAPAPDQTPTPERKEGALMDSWRKTFRDGFAPSMSTRALESLALGLKTNDPRLIQGATTEPPPLACVQNFPCEAGCLLAYSGWQGEELATVGETEAYFAKLCFEADQRLGEPAACRHLLNWYDDGPRIEVFRELLAEVERELAERHLQETRV